MSLPIDEIVSVLSQHLPSDKVQAIAKDLIVAEQDAKASQADAAPKQKTKQVVLIRGDASLKALVAGGGWIVRVKEDDQTATLQTRFAAVAKAFNERLTRHRATRSIKTFARLMEWGKGKVVTEVGAYRVLTRTPVEVQVIESEAI